MHQDTRFMLRERERGILNSFIFIKGGPLNYCDWVYSISLSLGGPCGAEMDLPPPHLIYGLQPWHVSLQAANLLRVRVCIIWHLQKASTRRTTNNSSPSFMLPFTVATYKPSNLSTIFFLPSEYAWLGSQVSFLYYIALG